MAAIAQSKWRFPAGQGGRHRPSVGPPLDPLGLRQRGRHAHPVELVEVAEPHPGLHHPAVDLLGVRDWQNAGHFGEAERAVLAATDETLRDGTISDETWAECQRALHGDPAVLVELVAAIGNWRLFSALLRSLHVPLEDGLEGWPPDGVRPSVD